MTVREEIVIGSKADTRGFKQAESAVTKLSKSVKALGATYIAYQAADFFKQSAKAFLDDQLAATRLTTAVKNLGLEFANPYITDYISNLEKTSKVADDELRPAFQRLLQQTGSISKSQDILNTSIEVSRGSTESLSTVTEDLARAYYGNTRSLKKYSLGLTDAELKTKSFTELQDILDKKFAGSSKAYLETYAGQVSMLALSFNNLKEKAGEALFTLAGGGGGAGKGAANLSGIMDMFGVGLVESAKLLSNAAMAFGQAYLGVATPLNDALQSAPAAKPGQELFRKSMANDAKLKAIEKQQAALYKAQMASLKAITAEQKKQAALKKAGTVFDLEQANLIAALKGKLSAEDKLRAEAQLALLNENDVLATQLTKQILMGQDQTGKLYQYFLSIGDAKIKNPFSFLDDWVVAFQKKLDATLNTTKQVASYTPAALAPELAAIGVVAGYGAGTPMTIANQASNLDYPSYGMQTGGGDTIINVQVQGNVIREQELINQVLAGTQLSSLSGSPSQIGRIAGMFG